MWSNPGWLWGISWRWGQGCCGTYTSAPSSCGKPRKTQPSSSSVRPFSETSGPPSWKGVKAPKLGGLLLCWVWPQTSPFPWRSIGELGLMNEKAWEFQERKAGNSARQAKSLCNLYLWAFRHLPAAPGWLQKLCSEIKHNRAQCTG